MNTPNDLSAPRELAAFVEGKSDADIEQALAERGVDPTLDGVFESMTRRFLPDKASGAQAVIQWRLETPDGPRTYVLNVEGERCTVDKGEAPSPRVTLTARTPTFLRVTAGRVNALQAFSDGDLRIHGEQVLGLTQQLWFDVDLSGAQLDVSTPSELAALIKDRTDDEIRAGVEVTGVDKALEQVFTGMLEHYLPEKGPKKRAVIEFAIGTPAGERRYQFVPDKDGSTYHAGSHEKSNVEITVELPDFLRLVSGKLNGVQALTQGKVKVRGNLFLANGVQSWFDMSR